MAVPAAVALKRLYPERRVVSISGDGDFLMSGQEFVTAAQYALPIICLVLDNGMYGSIRLHQEKNYPGRVCATDLKNPDFALWAKSCGGFGATVIRTEDFPQAFLAAEASGLPALIHVKYDADGVAPALTLSGVRPGSRLMVPARGSSSQRHDDGLVHRQKISILGAGDAVQHILQHRRRGVIFAWRLANAVGVKADPALAGQRRRDRGIDLVA